MTACAGIAAAVVAAVPLPAAADGTHRVGRGDTVSEIAAAHGTTVRSLAQANGLADADRIIAGQVLVIPSSATAATVVHVVAPGETLGGLARRYGTSTRRLADANGLSDPDRIRIGQRLTITAHGGGGGAEQAGGGAVHTVAPGDTVGALARRYGTSVGAIVAANGLSDPDRIRIGQRLTIPAAGAGGHAPARGGTSAYAATGGSEGRTGVPGTHLVAPGQTLAGIARHHGVSTADLAAANGIPLPPGTVYAGTRLRLDAGNRLPTDIAACPVPGARFSNDWGFARSGGRTHQGTDLFAPRGTPVHAPVAGTVSYGTGSIGGRQFRLIGVDGTVYLGSHLHDFGRAGPVAAGDVVGYVGSSGNAAGGPTHLHFEVHPDNGAAMNPYPLLRQAC